MWTHCLWNYMLVFPEIPQRVHTFSKGVYSSGFLLFLFSIGLLSPTPFASNTFILFSIYCLGSNDTSSNVLLTCILKLPCHTSFYVEIISHSRIGRNGWATVHVLALIQHNACYCAVELLWVSSSQVSATVYLLFGIVCLKTMQKHIDLSSHHLFGKTSTTWSNLSM